MLNHRHTMPERDDAERLAELLSQQREQAALLKRLTDPKRTAAVRKQLKAIRDECITLVDRYFRQVLEPILAKKFPDKVYRGQKQPNKKANVGAIVQFTELLNDFFVQVLSKFDDPFWQQSSAVQLRNFAATQMSRDILDELRHRKIGVRAAETYFWNSHFADEAQERFTETGLNLADTLALLDRWDEGEDEKYRQYAQLLRHYYISEMTMEEIANDMQLNLKTAYRRKQDALKTVRENVSDSHRTGA